MRLGLVVALGLAVLVAGPAPARAQLAALPAEPQLERVDRDAAVYLSFTLDAETALRAWAARATGTQLAPALLKWLDEHAAARTRRLGFDTRASWSESGLAPDVPVVASLFAVDAEATEKAFRARADRPNDAKALARAPRVWNRSRLVALVRDEKKLRAALTTFAAGGPELVLSEPAASTPALAAVFRAEARQGKGIAAALKRAKVVAVARAGTPWGHDLLVFVRVLDRRWLVVDALWAFGGVPVDWKLDGSALIRLLGRKVDRENPGPGVDLHLPPGRAFGGPGVGLVVHPERLLDLGKFIGWSRVLQAASGIADAATARSVLDTGEREVVACEDFRPLASEGPLAGFVLAATPVVGGLDVDAYWALRAPGVLDEALATSDDGLVDLAAAGGVKLLGLLPLAGSVGLRKLARPGALAQERHAIDERARLCGGAAGATLWLLGWPQYLTLFMDSDASMNELFAGLRNLAVAVKSFGARPAEQQMVVLASVDKPVLHDDFDRVLKRGKASAGKRKLVVWKSGQPGEPWAVSAPSSDGKRTLYGLAWGGDATLAWWWGQPTPASPGGPTPFVALLRTELPWFVQQVAAPVLGAPGLGELAVGLGALKSVLTLEPEMLHLHASIEVK